MNEDIFFQIFLGTYDYPNYCLHRLILWGEECYTLLMRPLLKMIITIITFKFWFSLLLGYHTDHTFWSGVEIAFICGVIHYYFFWRVRCVRLKCTFIYGVINLYKRIMGRWMETFSFFPNLFGAYDDQNYCLHCLIFLGEECYRLLLRPLLKMIYEWCMKIAPGIF